MNRSESIKELATALAKAQGAIEGAKKDSQNPFFKSSYADLASVWDACRKPLSSNGLSVVQTVNDNGGVQYLETILLHVSGEWISGAIQLNPTQPTPQGIGSAITYMRRYGLQAMVGIAPEDDDGNAASGKQKQQEKPSNDALSETSVKHREFVLKNLPAAKSVAVYANNINNWRDSGEMTEADYHLLKEAITKKHAELTHKEDK
jgi:hypothetical protein